MYMYMYSPMQMFDYLFKYHHLEAEKFRNPYIEYRRILEILLPIPSEVRKYGSEKCRLNSIPTAFCGLPTLHVSTYASMQDTSLFSHQAKHITSTLLSNKYGHPYTVACLSPSLQGFKMLEIFFIPRILRQS
jgi:hypothetical protein